MTSFTNFKDLGNALGRKSVEKVKGRNMSNAAQSKPLTEYQAITKYYNHNKRYGFVFVSIPANETLDFEIVTSQNDDSPGSHYAAGEKLDRDVVIEAFIHGSVIEKVGYDMGLEEGQQLIVKIALNTKGIQVVWTQNKDGSRPRMTNEPRKANSYLAFVDGKVKVYHPDRNFGFIIVGNHPETGEPLTDEDGNPTTREVHFTRVTLTRAGYSHAKEGQVIPVRYWTYRNGKSSVAQFKFPDANTDPDTLAEGTNVSQDNSDEDHSEDQHSKAA